MLKISKPRAMWKLSVPPTPIALLTLSARILQYSRAAITCEKRGATLYLFAPASRLIFTAAALNESFLPRNILAEM